MSNIKRQLQRLQGVVPVAALVIPAAFVGFLILKYSVDLPQWDEWTGVTFLFKLNEGTLSLSDLFRQHNEYRQFFPNLIFVPVNGILCWVLVLPVLVSSRSNLRRNRWWAIATKLISAKPGWSVVFPTIPLGNKAG